MSRQSRVTGRHPEIVTLDEWSTTPLYRQLADLLRKQIEDGTYPPGGRLPSEPTLQQEHGLARDTVRAAIRVLREEERVVTLPGRGTFVKPAGADPST